MPKRTTRKVKAIRMTTATRIAKAAKIVMTKAARIVTTKAAKIKAAKAAVEAAGEMAAVTGSLTRTCVIGKLDFSSCSLQLFSYANCLILY